MEEDKKIEIIMSCNLGYSLSDDASSPDAAGEAEAKLDEENLAILPSFGETLFFPLRDVLAVSAADHKIELTTPGEKLLLFDLGYKYEDFLRSLCRQRAEVLLKDMLMQETIKNAGAESDYSVTDEGGREKQKGRCEPRLYETALVLIPQDGDPLRLPYADISQISEGDYSLTLGLETGEKIVLSAMGSGFAAFKKGLSQTMTELSLNIQTSLKEMLPDIPPQFIRKLSRVMGDGRAAKRLDIDAVSPEIWPSLEKRLETSGIADEYKFLKSLSREERVSIGIKRGLLGDLTGEYIWFLMPVYSAGSDLPGNAIAMESISGEEGGRATYFFRIMSRKEYRAVRDIEDLHLEADNLLKQINRCMMEINFRREPIYLSEAKLQDPQYIHYHFSIRRLPSLRMLRDLFIGRVIHSSAEQWKRDVVEILKFNADTADDTAKWK